MKNRTIVLVFVLMAVLCGTAFSQNASDFTVDAQGVITKYSGFDTVIVIPATIGGKKITAIGDGAFERADLTSVTIPEGVTSIGALAFRYNKLTSVTIPNSVTSIGVEAFNDNPSLASVTFSERVETIGDRAFDIRGKPSFTLAANNNVEFSSYPMFYSYIANDRKAGTYAFFDLQSSQKDADNYTYYETQYGAVLTRYKGDSTRVRIPTKIGGIAVKALCKGISMYDSTFNQIDAVQIPEGITYIGKDTFKKNHLSSVTIPNGVTYLSGFNENQLTSVTIPNSVMYIGKSAFAENQLTSITIPNSVTTIGEEAFSNNRLNSITISNSVTTIGNEAFMNNQLASVTIPNGVTSISERVFLENQLTSVIIPNGVITIGKEAFRNNQLTSVTIPKSIISIGDGAFNYNKLASITIPNSVTFIGKEAFLDNPMTRVTIGGNVEVNYDSFFYDLGNFYNNSGKVAGTYVLDTSNRRGSWSRQR